MQAESVWVQIRPPTPHLTHLLLMFCSSMTTIKLSITLEGRRGEKRSQRSKPRQYERNHQWESIQATPEAAAGFYNQASTQRHEKKRKIKPKHNTPPAPQFPFDRYNQQKRLWHPKCSHAAAAKREFYKNKKTKTSLTRWRWWKRTS